MRKQKQKLFCLYASVFPLRKGGTAYAFMLINGPLWCYFYAMKYVEDYDASALRRFHCTQPEGNALVYGTEKDLLAGLDFVKSVWLATTLPALQPKPNFPAPFTLRTAAASPVILRKDMRLRCFG